MELIHLIIAGLLPVLLAFLFCFAEKQTKFGKCSYGMRQLIIGACFGLLAVFSTTFSIDIGGAGVNVRDAAPLTAGLLFGGPAGILAGLIGAIHRWFASLWGIGTYTRLACTLATGAAGFLAAAVRKYLLDNKKASWMYGLAVGMTMEVCHMLLIFVTNMSDLYQAFFFVRECAVPMIIANSASVTLAALVLSAMRRKTVKNGMEAKKIAQTFQLWLMVCVVIAFLITCEFSYIIQDRMAQANTEFLLDINMQDVRNDIKDASDANLLSITRKICTQITDGTDAEQLEELKNMYGVSEINIIDADGFISVSTDERFEDYDMRSGEQSAEFMCLLEGETELVQAYMPISYNQFVSRKYAGVALENGGAVQVGYDKRTFQKDIAEFVVQAARNRHIGQKGCVMICDEEWMIVSDRDGHEGMHLMNTGLWIDTLKMQEATVYEGEVYGETAFWMFTKSEGYYIISMLPKEEALFSRHIAVYILMFMEIIVFAALFAYIYFLIKKLIVEKIEKVNDSLAQITGGNLNVTVDVRSNEEFASLSDDINSTVNTLKRYIDEAAARIDAELEFAQTIQYSSLPSIFPPYPHRKDFEIFASMDTAKEVGGDFYDFYLLNENELAFLIADVSGKGIPAAMFMMKAKTMIKSLAESGMNVAEVFTKANEYLCEGNDANMFVTAWMGVLNLTTGHVEYANAGHNPPVVQRKDGSYDYVKVRPNFVLAGMEGMRYRKHEMEIEPGEAIYLYTDGITEAQNLEQELYGEKRLVECLNQAKNSNVEIICKKVKEDVEAFVGEAEQFDDMTMLCLKYHGKQSEQEAIK